MVDKDLVIQQLQTHITLQDKALAEMSAILQVMQAEIERLTNNQKKNSSNSSKPPSTDISKQKRTQSLRTSSGKKPGGQPGHPGQTLTFSTKPDTTIFHKVKSCGCCGKHLPDASIIGFDRRQVYDIPPIEMFVTEHKSEVKCCPHCNAINKGVFPDDIDQPVQYGINVRKLAVYFNQVQLLPFSRITDIFNDMFGHKLSSSFLVNNNRRCADHLQLFIKGLKAMLRAEPVLHVDETGIYFEGNRNWLHVICTKKFSYYATHATRGAEAMYYMDVLPIYRGRLVHDFWKPYYQFNCFHSICNVHHIRDLTFCEEVEQSIWAARVKRLLLDMHARVERAGAENPNATGLSNSQLKYWYKKYDALMEEGLLEHPFPEKEEGKRGVVKKTKTQNLLKRFIDFKHEILTFAKDFIIPFGNNLAEQAIRMMKVKQKISGCFRSEQGAKDFADIRSYIATAKKQGIPIMQALQRALQGTPLTVMG